MSREERKAMIAREHPGPELEPAMPPADDQPLLVLLHMA